MSAVPLLLFVTLLNVATPLAGDNRPDLRVRKEALETELRLAKKPGLYFVIDLDKERVLLKARGMTLRNLSITRKSAWGDIGQQQPRSLESKSALAKPAREKLKPGRKETEASPPALEVSDMPSRYLLHFSGGLTVRVNSEPSGLTDRASYGAFSLFWTVARPVLSLSSTVRGKPFQWIDLSMPESDAQALYWTLSEGTPSVLYAPLSPP